MKKNVIFACAAVLCGTAMAQDVKLNTFHDSASYAIGRDIFNSLAKQWDSQNLPIDKSIAVQAMLDCVNGSNHWTDEMAQPLLTRFQQDFEARQRALLQTNIDEGKKFMAANANNKSVYTTPSGLQYICLKKGNGQKPSLHKGEKGKRPDVVKVHYTGTLINGKVFDSSVERGEPTSFPLDKVIPGWTEGLQLMDVGSKYKFFIPQDLAYGDRQTGDIPPGSTLIFEVELLEITPSNDGPANAKSNNVKVLGADTKSQSKGKLKGPSKSAPKK